MAAENALNFLRGDETVKKCVPIPRVHIVQHAELKGISAHVHLYFSYSIATHNVTGRP